MIFLGYRAMEVGTFWRIYWIYLVYGSFYFLCVCQAKLMPGHHATRHRCRSLWFLWFLPPIYNTHTIGRLPCTAIRFQIHTCWSVLGGGIYCCIEDVKTYLDAIILRPRSALQWQGKSKFY